MKNVPNAGHALKSVLMGFSKWKETGQSLLIMKAVCKAATAVEIFVQ